MGSRFVKKNFHVVKFTIVYYNYKLKYSITIVIFVSPAKRSDA